MFDFIRRLFQKKPSKAELHKQVLRARLNRESQAIQASEQIMARQRKPHQNTTLQVKPYHPTSSTYAAPRPAPAASTQVDNSTHIYMASSYDSSSSCSDSGSSSSDSGSCSSD
jgi:hypothetical protein